MADAASYEYDLFVIGAGSGGVRAARMAAAEGARVGIAEDRYLGGTCVNVGCVPKKLYAYAAQFHDGFDDAAGFGWELEAPATFNWVTLRENKKGEIKRLNGIYQRLLEGAGVTLFNARATVMDEHTLMLRNDQGEQRVSAAKILVATGGWPWVPDFPGCEYAIDSNQVFDLDTFPERFLVLGGGYIAVEFASIFNGLGSESHLIYRQELFLRGFDHEVREFSRDEMTRKGVNLHFNVNIVQIEKGANGYRVTLTDGEVLEVDAVLAATGRHANIEGLGLDTLGIVPDAQGKIPVNERFETVVPSILALGDVISGPELTPVAIAEAMQLVDSHFKQQTPPPLDYDAIPTAAFCHPNIASVGLTEEAARERNNGSIRVYRTDFRAMQHTLSGSQERTLMKLIVDDATDVVIGAHIVGDSAGELMQGIAVAVRAGLKKADFDRTVGIHPTSAEEFVTLRTLSRR